jgi:hypothetical protein
MRRLAFLLAALCLATPAHAGLLDLAPVAEAQIQGFPEGSPFAGTYRLNPPTFDRIGVFLNRESAALGVLLFDLAGLEGRAVESATLTIRIVGINASGPFMIALLAQGFADDDGVVAIPQVAFDVPLAPLGHFPDLLGTQMAIDEVQSLDVTAFVRSLAAGGSAFAGFRLGTSPHLNDGFTLASSTDRFGRGPVLSVALAVPEPASLALVAGGLAVLGLGGVVRLRSRALRAV